MILVSLWQSPTPAGYGIVASAPFYNPGALRTGDVIFRRGRSVVSEIVLTADRQGSFSHVGMVLVEAGIPWVVHATPDEPVDTQGAVVREHLNQFLSADRASATAVYRASDPVRADHAAAVAADYARRRLPFDAAFDLLTSDNLYCTELVWRAYLEVGLDLTGGNRDELPIPLGRGLYLLPGTLLSGHLLEAVEQFTNPRMP